MSSIWSFVGSVAFWLLEKWVNRQAKKKQFQESYYAFLKAVDQSGAKKVANHLAAQNALKAEQEKLLEELKSESENTE